MAPVTTVGTEPARIDIDVYPGEPVDFTVPVYNAAGTAQDLAGWTLAAQIRASRDTAVLYTFTLSEATGDGGVIVAAAGDDTLDWAAWPSASARWDLWLTPPASESYLLAAGRVRIQSTITH